MVFAVPGRLGAVVVMAGNPVMLRRRLLRSLAALGGLALRRLFCLFRALTGRFRLRGLAAAERAVLRHYRSAENAHSNKRDCEFAEHDLNLPCEFRATTDPKV